MILLYKKASFMPSNHHLPLFKLRNQENEHIEQRLESLDSTEFRIN